MADVHMTVDVTKLPKVLADLRRELAQTLRAVADSEADPRVAARLREIAAQFEAGVTEV